MQETEDLVILDGISFVAEWPLELAESLLADPTPWWGSWPGDPTDQPNREPDYRQLANCVYAYCRYTKMTRLLRDSDMSSYTTQQLLDALYFAFRFERFGYGHIRSNESRLRQAVQEVVRRAHSEHPPQFSAVTRLPLELIYDGGRVGVLIPYKTPRRWIHCRFEPDPAFAAILPRFEEAYQLTKDWDEQGDWSELRLAYAEVNALKLSVLRADGKSGVLTDIRIHEREAVIRFEQRVLC